MSAYSQLAKNQRRYHNSKIIIYISFLCRFSIVVSILFSAAITAKEYQIPAEGSRLIGVDKVYTVKKGDYFYSIARFYNIGLLALMKSNPKIDPFLPHLGAKLTIPMRMLLPNVPYRGIVINLPEFRLYYFPKDTNTVHVFPVGIGRADRPTPIMHSRIKSKIKDPSWAPSARTKSDYLVKYGKPLPAIVAPGRDNPLGKYALQLAFGKNNYLIHGTNQNFGIGMRVSAGCIRMNPADISWLFKQVSINDEVRIINHPIKISKEADGKHIMEVHSPLSVGGNEIANNLEKLDVIVQFNRENEIGNSMVNEALILHQGIAINVNI